MILGLFRRSANRTVIQRLYGMLVTAARQPSLYAGLDVPDTFEGRFESLTLHAALLLRRLQAAESPGPDIAQDLIDTIFQHLDRTLREIGVGDTSVPKRMNKLAEAFLGRSAVYDETLRAGDGSLAAALARNVYGGKDDGAALARYAEDAAARLATLPLQAFIDGAVSFPDPAAFVVSRAEP